MRRKTGFVILAIFMCVIIVSGNCLAKNEDSVYTIAQREEIHMKYESNAPILEDLFCENEAVGYLSLVEHYETSSVKSWAIKVSSWLLGEKLELRDYVEILTNLMTMQEGDFAEQVENQSVFNNLKSGVEYAEDVADILVSIAGKTSAFKEASPIMAAVSGGKDVIVANLDQVKYYEATIRSYEQFDNFLRAIKAYAEIGELKEAANTLLKANQTLLEKRLEYLADHANALAKYEAGFFMDHLSVALLKSSDLYQSNTTVKWFVDCGSNLAKTFSSYKGAAQTAFRVTILAGDIGFGTTNTFRQYQEMKVVADVAHALIKANSKVKVSGNYHDAGAIQDIWKKCEYYKMLITTHARGEFLVRQLLIDGGGVFSWFFRDSDESIEQWYADQIDIMGEYFGVLDKMFAVKKETVTTSPEIPREKEKNTVVDITGYINDFSSMYSAVGGKYSDETGDHEQWVIGDGIQYGNYMGSSSVDEVSINSDKYRIYGISVGQDINEAKKILAGDGWDVLPEDEYGQAKKGELNIRCQKEYDRITSISFWKDLNI